MPRFPVRTIGGFLAAALLVSGGCGELAVGPLPGGRPLAVTLARSDLASGDGLPRLAFLGAPGEIDVVWEVQSGPCLISSAQAERAGSVIQVSLERHGDPLALCVAVVVNNRYHFQISDLPPGTYSVRLIDDLLGQPPREVGRSRVSVGAGS